MSAIALALFAACALSGVLGQSTDSFASSLAAVPLAVRSPYLSAWMPSYNTPNGTQLVSNWPQFWANETDPVSNDQWPLADPPD